MKQEIIAMDQTRAQDLNECEMEIESLTLELQKWQNKFAAKESDFETEKRKLYKSCDNKRLVYWIQR
jgi:hypothetical protein